LKFEIFPLLKYFLYLNISPSGRNLKKIETTAKNFYSILVDLTWNDSIDR